MAHKKVIYSSVIMFLLIISFSMAVNVIPVVVRPLDLTGTLQPNTLFNYVFNFSNSSSCSPVLLSRSINITTDKYGIGSNEIDVSPLFVNTAPLYMCEYRDGDLRKVHNLGNTLSTAVRTPMIHSDYYCNATNCYNLGELYSHLTNLSQFTNDIGLGGNGTAITMSSITNNLDGTYTWHFSDGFNYTTGNLTGSQGIQGLQGLQGIAGQNGSNGLNGNDGQNGLNGTSVTLSSITNNLDGTYTWLFSEGFNFTTGNLTGSQGIQGLQGISGLNGSNASVISGDNIIIINNGIVTANTSTLSTNAVNSINQTTYTYYFKVLWTNIIGRITNVSQLTNDLGFLTTESDPIFVANNGSIWNAIGLRALQSDLVATNISIQGNLSLKVNTADTTLWDKNISDDFTSNQSTNTTSSVNFNNVTIANGKCIGGDSGGYICFNSTHTWLG